MLQHAATAANPDALNPCLHKRLQATFGHVEIAKRGQAASYHDPYGETYRVNCPLGCGDDQGKLYIPHLWGCADGDERPAYPKCWKGCLEEPGQYQRLRLLIFAGVGRRDRLAIRKQVRPGTTAVEAWDRKPIQLPGTCIPLSSMSPGEAARLYLTSRGFDAIELEERYGVCYCEKAADPYPGARDRIIIPIRENGQTIAWQGRRIFDGSNRPKYYNLPGAWKNQVLYGIDDARVFPFVVVVEGVTSVWRLGPPAVATLGKWLSPAQAEMIGSTWPIAVVWADDAQAWASAEQDYMRLTEQYGTHVVAFTAADGRDPAEHSHAEAWEIITNKLDAAGYDVGKLITKGGA